MPDSVITFSNTIINIIVHVDSGEIAQLSVIMYMLVCPSALFIK